MIEEDDYYYCNHTVLPQPRIPDNSLSMGDEHIDTIPETESDEVIKSSVENLVPIPRDRGLFRWNLSRKPALFFDEEIISDKIDASIISSPKIDSLLEQFSGELAHIDLIHPGFLIQQKLDPEGDIHLVERLLYDNSSPRPPEELNSTESFPPTHIPVEDSDSLMEEIDLFLASNESIPLGIDSDYSDSEGDNIFLERLLHDDPTPLPDIHLSDSM
ncbi:hypothetical protein Tco_1111479 [Tanacetum coccineum]|uniref:Reverse transcriptase domain-containing protein n=1 Tax=Tanacetum coccineum TaxID=301880 RepID=A0ABQ5IM60_9ASTR